MMNIKDYFSKIMQYCSDKENAADFIHEFIESTTSGIADDFNDNSTAEKFYNGSRFSKKSKVVLRNLDKESFIKYLSLNTMDAIESFKRAFGFVGNDNEIFADLLYQQLLRFLENSSSEAVNLFEQYKNSYEIGIPNNIKERHNPNFSGRKKRLGKINELFNQENLSSVNICQTIAGLGGIGKTQLAIRYAYKFWYNFRNAIWFVVAESSQTAYNDFLSFAKELKIPLPEEVKTEDLQSAVKNWLSKHSKWLLIFDNVESYDIIEPYLPDTISGHFIITTRDIRIMANSRIDLGVFDLKESCELFNRYFSKNDSFKRELYDFDDFDVQAPILAARLGFLPLALVQAAAFICATTCSIEEYLRILNNKSSLKALKVFEKEEEYAKPEYYENHVSDTWKISFERLKESSKCLLNLCAYMAPDKIPISFFVEMSHKLPDDLSDLQRDLNDEQSKLDIITDLRTYSLVTGNSRYINIHRLVQEVIRKSHEQGDEI